MRNIVVVPYTPVWAERYAEEAALIRAIFGQQLLSIHHIGSTAIAGMSAKPVIDIMPIVRNIQDLDRLNPAMINAGFEPRGEYGIPGRRFFVKGGETTRSHHIHAYESSHPEVARHIAFRDYLAIHHAEARQYATLKLRLAERHSNDIESYMNGKDGFIKSILSRVQFSAGCWPTG